MLIYLCLSVFFCGFVYLCRVFVSCSVACSCVLLWRFSLLRGESLMNLIRTCMLVALVVIAACYREPPPSHVIHNGKIVTVDPQFHIVEAMAIRDGRILATGTTAEILKLAGSGTSVWISAARPCCPG